MHRQASPVQLALNSNAKRPIRFLDTTTAYDIWSEIYDTDGNFLQALDTIEMQTLLPQMLSQMLSSALPRKIVDLGCGTGRNTTRLLDLPNTTVIGLDASPKMLAIARSRIGEYVAHAHNASDAPRGVQLELYDLLRSDCIPCCAPNADALISTLVLEHVPLSNFFDKISEMLKPDGLVLITNMHSDMAAIGQAGFVDPKTGEKVRTQSFAHHVDDVTREAQKQGFEVVGEIRERAVDEKMSEVLGVRARKWIGVTVWFGVCFRKQA